jgi:hypothetical protein
VSLPQAALGGKTAPPLGAPVQALHAAAVASLLRGDGGLPLPKVVGDIGTRAMVDRLVGATAVGSGEAEPAGSGRGCGGSPMSTACWRGAVVLLARDSGAA